MKHYLSFIFAAFCLFLSHAQATLTKETIARNKVKTITEKEFDNNSNEGCNTYFTTYDRNGNLIKWNWQRIGSFFEYEYDEKDREVAMIRKSKYDSTDVHIMRTTYDKHDNITSDYSNKFKNFYDKKNRLIKSVTLDDEDVLSNTFKTYKYNTDGNLIKEVHYENNTIENTILNTYDTSCRLVERREYNKSRIEFRNKEYAAYKKPIPYFLTNISYDEKGRIKEKYQYYSDPCESMDDHYLYKNFYTSNDLLEKTELFFRGRRVSTTRYTYTFH